jgi:hypothetical protein
LSCGAAAHVMCREAASPLIQKCVLLVRRRNGNNAKQARAR